MIAMKLLAGSDIEMGQVFDKMLLISVSSTLPLISRLTIACGRDTSKSARSWWVDPLSTNLSRLASVYTSALCIIQTL